MRVRRIDAGGDWTFGRGRASYAATSESVAQRVKTRLQSFKGDWFLDLDHGLPWFARFEKPADLALIEADIKRCILKTPGVDSLLAFSIDLDRDTRKCTIAVTVKDIYGDESQISVAR
jgi:hypothetical protein